jgi:Leucine-rich repeat (LRR) protein
LSFSYDNSKPKLFGKIFFTEQKFFALEEIDLSGHNLTAVNVNNLINLKSLKVDNNLLAEPLNLQTLPNLTYFSAFREKASESSLQVLLPAWFVPYTS